MLWWWLQIVTTFIPVVDDCLHLIVLLHIRQRFWSLWDVLSKKIQTGLPINLWSLYSWIFVSNFSILVGILLKCETLPFLFFFFASKECKGFSAFKCYFWELRSQEARFWNEDRKLERQTIQKVWARGLPLVDGPSFEFWRDKILVSYEDDSRFASRIRYTTSRFWCSTIQWFIFVKFCKCLLHSPTEFASAFIAKLEFPISR